MSTTSGWVERTRELDPALYDQFRPTYPEAMFRSIFDYAQLEPGSRCLEIGIGTGQATQPFLAANYSVHALEPSANLAAYASVKFGSSNRFTLAPTRFEDLEAGECFDLIFAATSFHWVRTEQRMKLLKSHLKPGATAALFWNHPRPLNPVHAALQPVYQNYMPAHSVKNTPQWNEIDADKIADEMRSAGFQDVQTVLFHTRREMTSSEYIGLLQTYSDHIELSDAVRVPFLNDLTEVIEAHGGIISIADTVDLHLGRR